MAPKAFRLIWMEPDWIRTGRGEIRSLALTDIARLCDVFYIGGTKERALFGEAVVAPDPKRLPHFFPLIKQHRALLLNKLMGIQFETLFTHHLYAHTSTHARTPGLKTKEASK